MFFVPYVLFQPPMTVLIRKIGPTIFLGTIVMTWAVIMIVRQLETHLGSPWRYPCRHGWMLTR
jgi:hypothetical protein